MTEALLLVAHPDDEVLFAGALLLQTPNGSWTIASMTGNSVRRRELEVAAETFRVQGVAVEHVEGLGLPDVPKYDAQLWDSAFHSWLGGWEPDIAFTHNREGEYGHAHHRTCNAIARSRLVCPVWEFYCPPESGVGPQWHGGAERAMHDDRKDAVFDAAYGRHRKGLIYHLPLLIPWLLAGQDTHTFG